MTITTRTAAAAAICAAVLLTGTACTSDGDGPETSAQKSTPAATPTATAKPAADATQHVDGETVTEAPKLDNRGSRLPGAPTPGSAS